MAKDYRRIEQDILETVYELGPIEGNQVPGTRLQKYLGSDSDLQAVTVFVNFLLEERYLYPYFSSSTGREIRDNAVRGITPKGIERLRMLRHPNLTWMRKNWFGVAVAGINASIGIALIVVQVVIRSGSSTS